MLFLFRFFLFFASELSVVVLGKLILSEEIVPAFVFLAGMAFLVFLRALFFSGRPELVFFSARFSAGSLSVVLTFLCDFTENSLAEKFSSGAGKGTSDPRFAVAYMLAKSNQSYYPSSNPYAPTEEERKMINDIAKVGKVNIYYQGFRNTTFAAYEQSYALQEEIIKGQDIMKTLQKYQSIMKGLVDDQMKSWK